MTRLRTFGLRTKLKGEPEAQPKLTLKEGHPVASVSTAPTRASGVCESHLAVRRRSILTKCSRQTSLQRVDEDSAQSHAVHMAAERVSTPAHVPNSPETEASVRDGGRALAHTNRTATWSAWAARGLATLRCAIAFCDVLSLCPDKMSARSTTSCRTSAVMLLCRSFSFRRPQTPDRGNARTAPLAIGTMSLWVDAPGCR